MEDHKIEQHVHSFLREPTKVSHFIYATQNKE